MKLKCTVIIVLPLIFLKIYRVKLSYLELSGGVEGKAPDPELR